MKHTIIFKQPLTLKIKSVVDFDLESDGTRIVATVEATTLEEAKQKGYTSAFIVAYKDGIKINLTDAIK